jgi:hypothetical protein
VMRRAAFELVAACGCGWRRTAESHVVDRRA